MPKLTAKLGIVNKINDVTTSPDSLEIGDNIEIKK